jgi:hypothetical protein
MFDYLSRKDTLRIVYGSANFLLIWHDLILLAFFKVVCSGGNQIVLITWNQSWVAHGKNLIVNKKYISWKSVRDHKFWSFIFLQFYLVLKVMGISLCTWSLWGWFFSAPWTAFRAVRTASWIAFRAVRTATSWLFC